jgi:DNA-binding transcriptional MerR regulator
VEHTPSVTLLFMEPDVDALKIVECLKYTRMPIKDIKNFIDWFTQGDSSLQQLYDMFMERKAVVEAQMEELKKITIVIEHEC